MVAPSEEIAAREKLELEAQKQITELAPIQTEFIQVNYAKASEIATLLKKEENPTMWNLIFKFYEKTGVPALLNTSFNLHGEPIVRTVKDALRVFEKSELEVLWLENHIIEKKS